MKKPKPGSLATRTALEPGEDALSQFIVNAAALFLIFDREGRLCAYRGGSAQALGIDVWSAARVPLHDALPADHPLGQAVRDALAGRRVVVEVLREDPVRHYYQVCLAPVRDDDVIVGLIGMAIELGAATTHPPARGPRGAGEPTTGVREALTHARMRLCSVLSSDVANPGPSPRHRYRLEQVYEARAAIDEALARLAGLEPPTPPHGALGRPRHTVLVVDEDRAAAAEVASALDGFVATAIAGSRCEALRVLRHQSIDVVVCDESCLDLLDDEPFTGAARSPHLVLIADDPESLAVDAIVRPYVGDLVPKPVDPRRLRSLLRRVLEPTSARPRPRRPPGVPMTIADPNDSGAIRIS